MKLRDVYLASALIAALAAGNSLAADANKEKKRAEIQKMARAALPEFYKAEPKLKAEVEKAPGYAVFSTFGLSFIVGGSGGSGLVHDNKTKRDTYMRLAQGSVGVQAGIAESRTLIVFRDAAAMKQFVEKGWEAGAGGGVGAAIEGKGAGGAAGGAFMSDTAAYTLTRTGLQAGIAVGGAKFWKDDELN